MRHASLHSGRSVLGCFPEKYSKNTARTEPPLWLAGGVTLRDGSIRGRLRTSCNPVARSVRRPC